MNTLIKSLSCFCIFIAFIPPSSFAKDKKSYNTHPTTVATKAITNSKHVSEIPLSTAEATSSCGKKVVLVNGTNTSGLGNQLFLYAAGYTLAKCLDAELWYVVNTNLKKDFSNTARQFALDHFHVKIDRFITPDDYKKIKSYFQLTELNFFDAKLTDAKFFHMADYFESPKFFEPSKEIIKQFFEQIPITDPNSLKLLDLIRQNESVAVHIRRGDFRREILIPISYQIKAMQYMRDKIKSPHFFIFSDDPSFCRSAFANLDDVTIISDGKTSSLEEFYMMRECKHTITTNSTFSWWAGWLNNNPNKIVIAPLPRHSDSYYRVFSTPDRRADKIKLYTKELYPTEWITINPFKL